MVPTLGPMPHAAPTVACPGFAMGVIHPPLACPPSQLVGASHTGWMGAPHAVWILDWLPHAEKILNWPVPNLVCKVGPMCYATCGSTETQRQHQGPDDRTLWARSSPTGCIFYNPAVKELILFSHYFYLLNIYSTLAL